MSSSSEQNRPKRRDGVLAKEAQGRTVLLRLEDGYYYSVDDVGSRVWELCDGERTLDQVVSVICEEFDAPEETVRTDVLQFVDELEQEGLLEPSPA